MIILALTIAVCLQLTAAQLPCADPVDNCDDNIDYFPDKITIEHAIVTVPEVTYHNTYIDLVITAATGSQFKYKVVRCGCELAEPVPLDTQIVYVPPRGLHVADGPALSLMTTELPALPILRYINSATFVYSPAIRGRATTTSGTGEVKELGTAPGTLSPNYSLLINNSEVTLSVVNSFQASSYSQANTGVPYLVSAESSETTPLARAEWIKVFGIVLSAVAAANSQFTTIQDGYGAAKARAASVRRRPSVVLNMPYSDFSDGSLVWSLPSQFQYTTELLRDANVDYRFMDNGLSTTVTVPFQQALHQFKSAQFYINTGRFPGNTDTSLVDFLDFNKSPADLEVSQAIREMAAVRCGNVWANQKRVTSDGFANDYFEQAINRPDLVLRDLVNIFHPSVDAGGGLVFSYSYGSPPTGLGSCPHLELPSAALASHPHIDTVLDIKGLDRFEVEGLLEDKVLPSLNEEFGLGQGTLELLFESVPEPNATKLTIHALTNESTDISSIAIRNTVSEALFPTGGGVVDTASFRLVNTASGDEDSGIRWYLLAAGAVGLVLMTILFAIGVAQGKRMGIQRTKDRFWQEHNVRLLDESCDVAEFSEVRV